VLYDALEKENHLVQALDDVVRVVFLPGRRLGEHFNSNVRPAGTGSGIRLV